MEGIYLLVGGTVDSTEDELDCWCDEFGDLESARKAMEESVPVRDASRAIAHGYFVRVDQWDDELGGWQPCERGRTWTVLGFGGMRPDKGLSDGFEVAGPGPDRALCPDFDLLAEAVAHVEGSGTYRTRQDVPEGYAAWRANGGWVGVRPLWGEGPRAQPRSPQQAGRRPRGPVGGMPRKDVRQRGSGRTRSPGSVRAKHKLAARPQMRRERQRHEEARARPLPL